MSPRPRTIEDSEILAACQRVMQRVGPSRFTLALVGAEAGVSAATLVQRFGSKRRLLRAMTASSTGFGAHVVASLRAVHRSPLAVLREYLLCFAEMASTPREMANHLAWLQMDLTDRHMHRALVAMSMEQLTLLEQLLQEAMDEGELNDHRPADMARVLSAVATGGLLAWATFREGSAREWLARDLDVLLAPLQRVTGARRRRAR